MSRAALGTRRGLSSLVGSGRLMTAIVIFTTIGGLDAAYLTYVHYQGFGALVCFGAHHGHSSCETVQSSQWAQVDGVPVALLGLISYAALFVSYIITERVSAELGRATGFGIALIGFGFSIYLTYREIFTIHAICEWCVTSAVCLTVLAVLTAFRYLNAEPAG
ncbi:MAG: vitamin K epoxide reductase family protein [Solirubrobacteraceae bacterium]